MREINLRGNHTAAQMRKMESEILKSEGNEDLAFVVEYLATARRLARYAVLHGYGISVSQPEHYTFVLTVRVDAVRAKSLVDEAFAAIDAKQAFHPEFGNL